MDHNVFKFACNISSRVFKNYYFISKYVLKPSIISDYNRLYMKKIKPSFLPQNYFHTSTNYFSNSNEIINNKVEEKLTSETELHEDVKENIEKACITKVKKNVLLPASNTDDINFIAPAVKPTFNLAAYADRSVVLKHLIQLGVEIGKWDEKKEICANILNKNFEKDIKPYIFFLHEHGITVDQIGYWITRNPDIFEESLENIQIRINYLKSRKFTNENISRILERTPKWLNYNVIDIDRQLGNFQKRFKLLNKEVIALVIRDPKLILFIVDRPLYLDVYTRTIGAQFGFTMKEQKELLLGFPRIYRTTLSHLIKRFDVIHGEMELSHATMAKYPKVFGLRDHKLRERHLFLKFLGKAQYDPTKPGYISPLKIVLGDDVNFSTNVAASSAEIMNDFLKTL